MFPVKDSVSVYPTFLIIDAEEERAQQIARLLSLIDYRPIVTLSLYQAVERSLREHIRPQAIILGQAETAQHPLFSRLLGRLGHDQGREIPLILLQVHTSIELPLYASPSNRSTHLLSQEALQLLNSLWSFTPSLRKNIRMTRDAAVLSSLPSRGFAPRVSQLKLSRNSHFLQILRTAHTLIGEEQWTNLMGDVGLPQYKQVNNWPPDNDVHAIPAEYISCLHQAVAFSRPDDPIEQIRQWSQMGTAISLKKRSPSTLTQQTLKLLPREMVMGLVLNTFARQMNEIRGEELHLCEQQEDGSYCLVHYSNLYAYGRICQFQQPACHVWAASLETTLQLLDLDMTWDISEQECSCQTLTGHCIFLIKSRQTRR